MADSGSRDSFGGVEGGVGEVVVVADASAAEGVLRFQIAMVNGGCCLTA